jgi:hypothetical protein
VVEKAIEILLENGKPMTRGALYRELTRRGVVIIGRFPAKVLGTTLWRSDKLYSVEGEGYWPTVEAEQEMEDKRLSREERDA